MLLPLSRNGCTFIMITKSVCGHWLTGLNFCAANDQTENWVIKNKKHNSLLFGRCGNVQSLEITYHFSPTNHDNVVCRRRLSVVSGGSGGSINIKFGEGRILQAKEWATQMKAGAFPEKFSKFLFALEHTLITMSLIFCVTNIAASLSIWKVSTYDNSGTLHPN